MKNCEVIRDQKTGDSLQYAFVEFYDQPACEQAYFKMDNVLIGGLIQIKKMRRIGSVADPDQLVRDKDPDPSIIKQKK